jgi:hypothetical protein
MHASDEYAGRVRHQENMAAGGLEHQPNGSVTKIKRPNVSGGGEMEVVNLDLPEAEDIEPTI